MHGAGEPVVLIHGLSGSGRWWRHNVEPLAERFRVHVVDLAGFGKSHAGNGFVLAEAASLLDVWMDSIGLVRAHVVGHSMGGLVAAELAADFPERVDRLVLVDAAGLPLDRNRVRQLYGMYRALWSFPLTLLPVFVADARGAGVLGILRIGMELVTADIGRKLSKVRAPTLVVWGARDTIVPLSVGRQFEAAIPKSRLVVIEEAGHVPMWEAPDSFNAAVTAFLGEGTRKIPRHAAR